MRFREMREAVGKTQTEVAKYLGVSRQCYNNYELGNREPGIEILLRLSSYFGVSVDYLLGNENATQAVSTEDREIIEGIKGLTAEERKRVLDFIKFTKQQREGK